MIRRTHEAAWARIYDFVAGVADGFGDILTKIGQALGQDWGFTMPSQRSYIPHLAKGGLVKAPTLAMVGDNKGASHDPEVVSPLSKLESIGLQRQDGIHPVIEDAVLTVVKTVLIQEV